MKKSFTLIELMVVIAIAMLLVAGSITGLSASSKRRQVKTTAEKLKYVILEAIAQAKAPAENQFGLVKIEIDVYPWDYATASLKNQVKVYNCFDASLDQNESCAASQNEITKLSFKAPNSVYLKASNSPPDGNMTKPPGDNYYFFSIAAANLIHRGQNIGVGELTDWTNLPGLSADHAVFLRVMDEPSTNPSISYEVKAFVLTGLVTSEKKQ